jgi:hypothetical protein
MLDIYVCIYRYFNELHTFLVDSLYVQGKFKETQLLQIGFAPSHFTFFLRHCSLNQDISS